MNIGFVISAVLYALIGTAVRAHRKEKGEAKLMSGIFALDLVAVVMVYSVLGYLYHMSILASIEALVLGQLIGFSAVEAFMLHKNAVKA